MCQAAQAWPERKILRRLDIRRETARLERLDEPPAEVDLTGKQTHLGGFGKGMMIVVPALAHTHEAGAGNVVALAGRALYDEALAAAAMGEMPDQPMARHAHAHPHADAPHQPACAADRVKQYGPRELLEHPGALDESIEPVVGEPRLRLELGRMRQHEPAMQLPPSVAPEARAMAGIVVTCRLALRPIAKIVDAHHADRAGHPDQCAQVDAQMLEPQRTIEA